MDKHENFKNNLTAIKNMNEFSLTEFSKELGIPKSTLQSVLKDGNTSLDTAIRISEGLNVPLDVLLGDELSEEKADVLKMFLKGFSWFDSLSPEVQTKVSYHLEKLLEALKK